MDITGTLDSGNIASAPFGPDASGICQVFVRKELGSSAYAQVETQINAERVIITPLIQGVNQMWLSSQVEYVLRFIDNGADGERLHYRIID